MGVKWTSEKYVFFQKRTLTCVLIQLTNISDEKFRSNQERDHQRRLSAIVTMHPQHANSCFDWLWCNWWWRRRSSKRYWETWHTGKEKGNVFDMYMRSIAWSSGCQSFSDPCQIIQFIVLAPLSSRLNLKALTQEYLQGISCACSLFYRENLMQNWSNSAAPLLTRKPDLEPLSDSDLHSTRPAGLMLPSRAFSIAENIAKAKVWWGNCHSRISFEPPINLYIETKYIFLPATNLCWSTLPFELYELCRPGITIYVPQSKALLVKLGAISYETLKLLLSITLVETVAIVHLASNCDVLLLNGTPHFKTEWPTFDCLHARK